MPANIDFILDDNKALKVFEELLVAGSELTPVMREIAGILADATEQAFANETDPTTGKPWEKLSDAHTARRAEQGYTGAILQMTGDLASSVQSDHGNDYAQVGSNKVYAAIHQHGGLPDMRPANAAIDARPFLGAGKDDQQEILDVVARHLSNALNA